MGLHLCMIQEENEPEKTKETSFRKIPRRRLMIILMILSVLPVFIALLYVKCTDFIHIFV